MAFCFILLRSSGVKLGADKLKARQDAQVKAVLESVAVDLSVRYNKRW